MERSRVAKRFRELGWDPVLPDPQDDRHAREVKTQNLRQALQLRRTAVDQAHAAKPPPTDLATHSKPPLLPSKRPPRMQNLSAGKDSSYQTPPTQKMSAPGLALANKPLQKAQLNTNEDGSGSTGGGFSTGPITTGPKAAALTAQGLLVSAGGDTKKNPSTTDPLSRLLQGNNSKANNNTTGKAHQETAPAADGANDDTPNDLLGWKRAVKPSEYAKPSLPIPPHEQKQKQTRLPIEPPLRRSQRRGASRLIHSSGASALLKDHGGDNTGNINATSRDIIDPIIASPTQSPPIKLTMPRVIVHSPIKNHDTNNEKKVAVGQPIGKNKRKLDVQKVGEGGGGSVHVDGGGEEEEERKEKDESFSAATEEGSMLPPPSTRPTPLDERTQAPHGPRPRRPVNPLPLPQLTESVPATPAGLFDVSETPEGQRRGGIKRIKNNSNNNNNNDNIKVTGTELAQDASNKLLPGVFSPLTEHPPALLPPGVETAVEERAASGTEERNRQIENKNNSLHGDTKLAAILEETEATPAAYNHNRFSTVLETGCIGAAGTTTTRGAGARLHHVPLRRATSARLAALLAADMVPETAVNDIDIYALDEAAAVAGAAENPEGATTVTTNTTAAAAAAAVGNGAITTTAKKYNIQSTAAPPHTALPTLRPFSPTAFSLPRSTDRRPRFYSSLRPDGGFTGRLGGGDGGGGGSGNGALGDVTPVPMMKMLQQQHQQQAPYSLLPGFRNITTAATPHPNSSLLKPKNQGSGSALQTAMLLPLPTGEEPLSMKLCLPQPALAVLTSSDGQYMAVLLGSHADWEPCEVLVFDISLERASSNSNISDTKTSAKETAAGEVLENGKKTAPAVEHTIENNVDANIQLPNQQQTPVQKSAAQVIASISVQRSHYAAGLPITPSSLALASTPKGDPILILSGVYDLPDGPASLGRPTIHAVYCTNGSADTTTTTGASTALGVESDDPFFSLAMLGPHTLLAVGDGSSGASIINFDPHWKSYSWGSSLPPALIKNSSSSGGGGEGTAIGLDDVCSLLITPYHHVDTDNSTLTISRKDSKKQQLQGGMSSKSGVDGPSTSQHLIVTSMSATGMVGCWEMNNGKASVLSTGSHADYAVRAAIPIPHISLKNSSETPQCFVALLQSRESAIGETAVAVATLSPSGGLVLGTPVPVPVSVTAIGSLTPPLPPTSTAFFPNLLQDTEIAPPTSRYHHNQDKILLGCGNGTLRVWNIRTGVCSPPLDICSGAAITSFATVISRTEAVICTSIAGDCIILETAALLELVE